MSFNQLYDITVVYHYSTPEGDWTDCTTGITKTYLAGTTSGAIPPPPSSATLYMNLTVKP